MPDTDRSRLRILVDAAIVKPHLGGIASYAIGVVSGLAALGEIDICVATSVPELFDFPTVELIELPAAVRSAGARAVWRERRLRSLAVSTGADVLFAPNLELAFIRRPQLPAIAVVHDIGPIVAPSLYGGRRRQLQYLLAARLASRRAAHILCVSAATLDALRARLGPIAAPCSVAGEAGRILPVLERNVQTSRYVLSVGAMLAHKNIATLVAAMDSDALANVHLELAGPLDTRERALLDLWRSRLRRPERVVHHGFVEPERLAELYAGSALVALPSLYEGFGLSMLEAMRAGAPVVASELPALRELGGSAGTYIADPLSVSEWVETLTAVLADGERMAQMARGGRERAARFAWPEIGAQIASIARALAQQTGKRRAHEVASERSPAS